MKKRLLLTAAALCAAASPAAAQRAGENAIADAEDAFGSNDGGEDLGLYGPYDVRGFSPIDAGNVRLEGLYIDRQADLSPRLVAGNRIRVGLTAVGYGLPAPSGIVDYRLRTPGGDPRLSGVVQANSFGGHLVELDGQMALAEGLNLGGGISASRSEYASGNNADVYQAAAILSWRLSPDADVRAFWSGVRIKDEDIYPIIQGDGADLPPRLVRRRFLGQDWADVETERMNAGAVARGRVGDWSVRAGLFRLVNEVTEGHSVFLQAAEIGVLADRSVSAYPGREGASTSGEIGAARAWTVGDVEHRLALIARARQQTRRYGGGQRLSLPDAPFGSPRPAERPDFAFGPQSVDEVEQWAAGAAYTLASPGWGRLSMGVQKAVYRKDVLGPAGPEPGTRDDPWLYNLAGVVEATDRLSFYASMATGLEESEAAPQSAVNRDEAPPAIRTRQVDAGALLAWGPYTLVVGGFQIERPYFGTDPAGYFRALGDVRHRGLEASVTGSPRPGLTLVAGAVLLDARVEGEEAEAGRIGERPVGAPSSKLIASLDWRAPGSAFSWDLSVERLGPAWADSANRVEVDANTVVDLGARYRFEIGGRPAVLRVQATNLLNSYSWDIVGENSFVYTQPRQIAARLTVDF